jgi:hypothetical protein
MPEFFPRLLQLLRIINYGPSLEDLLTSHLITHSAMTLDLSSFFSPFPPTSSSSYSSSYSRQSKKTDWDHFTSLEEMVRNEKEPFSSFSSTSNSEESVDDEKAFLNQLLSAFSPSSSSSGSLSRNNSASAGNNATVGTPVELTNVINIIEVAQSIGIAHNLSPLGEALLLMQSLGSRGAGPLSGLAGHTNNVNQSRTGTTDAAGRRTMNSASTEAYLKAKKELVFHSMLLLSYQIELIFVLCTLLSGRRKLAVQKKLAKEGLGSVLLEMFRRMSFSLSGTTPALTSARTAVTAGGERTSVVLDETSHVTAIRIQYLRLIHCFYDRDFLGNENKLTVLSSGERDFLLSSSVPSCIKEETINKDSDREEKEKQGLIMKIIDVLFQEKETKTQEIKNNPSPALRVVLEEGDNEEKKENSEENALGLSPESVSSSHHFWLFACLENFLRGSGTHGQLLFLRKKKEFLPFLISHILETVFPPVSFAFSSPVSTAAFSLSEAKKSILQSCFDLLNELIKGNPEITKELEDFLSSSPLLAHQFFFIIMNNLVESNVFIRSLFLNCELFDKPSVEGEHSSSHNMTEATTVKEVAKEFKEDHHSRMEQPSSQLSSTTSVSSSSTILLEGYGFNINGLTNCETLYLLTFPFPSSSSSVPSETIRIFRFGYLMNSFIQFNNCFLNENAKIMFVENKEFYYNERRKRKADNGVTTSSTASSSTVTSPSRTTTLRNNIKEGIRKATTHLLRFGGHSSPSSSSATASASPPSAVSASAPATMSSSPPSSTSLDHGSVVLLPSTVVINSHLVLTEDQIIDKIISSAPPSVCSSFSIASSQPVIQPHPLDHLVNAHLVREESFLFSTPPEEPRYSRFPRRNDDTSSTSSLSHLNTGLHNNLSSFPSFPSFGDSTCLSMNTALTSRLHAIHLDEEIEEKNGKENSKKEKNIAEKSSDIVAAMDYLSNDSSSSMFSSFIKYEKLNILFRLITSISLKSINHENICCLNTALLLLLFDFHRYVFDILIFLFSLNSFLFFTSLAPFSGVLPSTLNKIRVFANQQYCHEQQQNERLKNDSNHFHYSPSTSPQDKASSVSACCYCSSLSNRVCFNCRLCQNEKYQLQNTSNVQGNAASPNSMSELQSQEGENIVMKNLRELLWYWIEYYLRRGRDRLSIEFSSRIPFRFWYHLVGNPDLPLAFVLSLIFSF